MESMEFKRPFPTLQDLAVLKIAHSLMDLEVSEDTFLATKEKSLRESLSKVDKLEVLDEQKCRIREVLKGTHDHLQNWFTSHISIRYIRNGKRPKLQFDVHGRVDEVRMARVLLQKCYSDERYDTDLVALQNSLMVASYNALFHDIQEISLKFLKLHSKRYAIAQLEGPKFQIDTDEKLYLVYRVVDQQGIPMLDVDYSEHIPMFPDICVSNSCVRITLLCYFYNFALFQLHWNLLEPSKRIPFVRKMIITKSILDPVTVINILHLLDSDSRRCILDGNHSSQNVRILSFLLVWPYQVLFLPALQLVRSSTELQHSELIDLFKIIVRKQDMMAFKEILPPFWKTICSEVKSRYSHSSLDKRFKDLLKELSQKNVPMYKRVSADLNLPLIHLPESRKRKHDESSSSNLDV